MNKMRCICRKVNSLNMEKSWMLVDRRSVEYENTVNEFLKFAVLHASNPELLRCPCQACLNL